jgi:hypothetical protein
MPSKRILPPAQQKIIAPPLTVHERNRTLRNASTPAQRVTDATHPHPRSETNLPDPVRIRPAPS